MTRHLTDMTATEISIIDWLHSRASLGDMSDHLAFRWGMYLEDHTADEFNAADQERGALFKRFSVEHTGNPDIILQPDLVIRAYSGTKWLVTTITTECLLGMDGQLSVPSRMGGVDVLHHMSWTLRNSLHEALIGGRYANRIYTDPGPLDADGNAIAKEEIWHLVEDLLYFGVAGITEWLSDFHVRAVYRLSFGLASRGYAITPAAPDDQPITGRIEYLLALAD
ncbi:MAG: hypothetical protein Q8K20_03460 [Gemmobacter sp.]|nr:hypothetical protein [Gemmobacter sp.]